MCGAKEKYSSSHQPDGSKYQLDGSIGDLFRDFGEQYIRSYCPGLHQIKFIKALRVCKTPALGGRVIVCKDCGHGHYIYHSCGHSQCPLCQSIKRLQWQDKLSNKLLKCPYVHVVFTLPHELNRLMKLNKKVMYNMIMRVSWKTIKQLSAKEENMGALPGMISVLHTFGSDMKYHVHVHSLLTFGGMSSNGWQWPKRKKKIGAFREMSKMYRELFMKELRKKIGSGEIEPTKDLNDTLAIIATKRWNVHQHYPTMQTELIEQYLSRYINRVAISKNRLTYLRDTKEVQILYNDYRNQQEGEPAPKAYRMMPPLLAIDQILQHLLPPYFQKVRYYGLHSSRSYKKWEEQIPAALKKNNHTIRTVFQILKSLLDDEPYACEKCQSTNYEVRQVKSDKSWKFRFLTLPSLRAPPLPKLHITPIF